MTMPAFPSPFPNPSTPSNLQMNFNTLAAQFGANYLQVAPNGYNSAIPTWNLEWDNLSAANSATLETFLNSVGTYTFFTWTPPSGIGSVWRIDSSVNSYGYQKTTTGLVNSYQASFTMVAA